ncbi:hypothetical protein [Nostoc piscinale]|nr:hypothetical protein [Nostoc piscinale]
MMVVGANNAQAKSLAPDLTKKRSHPLMRSPSQKYINFIYPLKPP